MSSDIIVTKSLLDSFDIIDRKKVSENFEILSANEKNQVFNIKTIKSLKFTEKSAASDCIKEVISYF